MLTFGVLTGLISKVLIGAGIYKLFDYGSEWSNKKSKVKSRTNNEEE